jgi:malate dehydrogenase (oxaloacetate-decarboxylating)(NADP+)
MLTGVAKRPIEDFDEYVRQLDIRMGRSHIIMSPIYSKAQTSPKTVVLPEGDQPHIIKAAQLAVDDGIARPILLGDEKTIRIVAEEYGYDLEGIQIVDPTTYPKTEEYIREYHFMRNRKGVTANIARQRMLTRMNYFGAMMVHAGDADSYISGYTAHYPDTIRPALEIIGRDIRFKKVSGLYVLSFKKDAYFLADTTVNINPTAEDLADITQQVAEFTENFDVIPRVAMLSYSNFGSAHGESPSKVIEALKLVRKRMPDLMVDGEMQADTATVPEIISEIFPYSTLKGTANVLIFPDLNSGNIAYKLLCRIGGAKPIGPILLGLNKAVHILQRGAEINEILDMIAIAVVDANSKG